MFFEPLLDILKEGHSDMLSYMCHGHGFHKGGGKESCPEGWCEWPKEYVLAVRMLLKMVTSLWKGIHDDARLGP